MSCWKLLSVFFVLSLGLAQGPDALTGRVVDDFGAGVPHAVIIITDSAGESRRLVTASDGSFRLSYLPSGTYRIEVERNGIRHAGRSDVEVLVGNQTQVEVLLAEQSPSGSPERVAEVNATTSAIQTKSAQVSRTYGSRVIRSLPVLDRQYQDLITLMPGITPPEKDADRVMDPQQRRTYNVNGQPSYTNVYHQDGSLNTEYFNGNVARMWPDDAVEALTVRTSNYNAEYGFAGGAWNNALTQTGTNAVHGTLFGFNHNSWFATHHPFNLEGNPEPRFNRNRFGGSLGAPLIRDRMFAFFSYEGYLDRGDQIAFATVPTLAMRTGDFSAFNQGIFNPLTGNPTTGSGRIAFPGARISAAQINPSARAILSALPEPNLEGFQNNLIGNTRLEQDMHRFDGKLDHRFTGYTGGFLRYGFTQSYVKRGSLFGDLGDAATGSLRNHDAAAGIVTSFGPDLLTEFRLGYMRYRNLTRPLLSTDFDSAAFGFPGGVPAISITGFGTLGFPNTFDKAINNSYSAFNNWIWSTGTHRLKIGAEARYISANGFDPGYFSPRGSFLFGPGPASSAGAVTEGLYARSLAAFLVGSPTQAGVANFLTTPTQEQWQGAGFITDTIRIWRGLHLELGMRYSVFSRVTPRNADMLLFDWSDNTTAIDSDENFRFGDHDWNNIAPRVGFAFSPFHKVALRGGYGIQYFALPLSYSLFNQRTVGIQTGVAGGFTSVPFTVPLAPSLPEGAAPNLPLVVGANQPVTPYLHTYNLMVQGDLGAGFLLDVGYVGNRGRQLPYRVPLAATPGSGVAGIPGFAFGRTAPTYELGYGLNSRYDAGQVNLTKRFSGGLAFAGSYTYSKAMNYGDFDLLNPFDRAANYAPADWDRKHIMAFSHVWRLPFGRGASHMNTGVMGEVLGDWEINGILRWASGAPLNVLADALACACPGVVAVTADIDAAFELDSNTGSFNPSIFSTPFGGFGNLGRNALRGPELFSYDLALFRDFGITEHARLELRAEAYNITNHTNYARPVSFVGAPAFGRPMRTFNGAGGRQFQLAARLVF